MGQVIKIRLQTYGDREDKMRDVGEIEIPQGFGLVKSIKIETIEVRPHQLKSVEVEFDTKPVA